MILDVKLIMISMWVVFFLESILFPIITVCTDKELLEFGKAGLRCSLFCFMPLIAISFVNPAHRILVNFENIAIGINLAIFIFSSATVIAMKRRL